MLTVDHAARTIAGRAVPWEVAGVAVGSPGWRHIYSRGVLELPAPARVRLLVRHNFGLWVGRALTLDDRTDGLWCTLRAANGWRGDSALELAATGWGLSIGLDPATARYEPDGSLWRCVAGALAEISLTPTPGFAQPEIGTDGRK